MNEFLGIEDGDKRRVVCNKPLGQVGGVCHVEVEDRMRALCRLLCVSTFEKIPRGYTVVCEANEIGTRRGNPEAGTQ